MIKNPIFENMMASPVRDFKGRIEIYENSALSKVCGSNDYLKEFTIERIDEENKFFGYSICTKLHVSLIDTKREINISTKNYIEAVFGVDNEYIYAFPKFEVAQVRRDEVDNSLSITAYCPLYRASNHRVSEIGLKSYTIEELAYAIANILALPLKIENVSDNVFSTHYPTGANFDGTEDLRSVINWICEATQTIAFVNSDWELVFKRPDIKGNAVTTIDKEKYFSLSSGSNRRLAKIISATELNDNISAELNISGSTQVIENNPFWDLRDDRAELIDNAIAAIGGITVNQFSMDFRGNFLLEPVDKIAIINKENETVYSYVLNESIHYNGGLSAKMEWQYSNSDDETEATSTTIGEAIKRTYAKVDKANGEIKLHSEKIDDLTSKVGELTLTAEEITQTVTETTEKVDGITTQLGQLTITADEITQRVSTVEENLDGTKTELESKITQTATEIRGEVSAQGKVITSIQQDLDGISLEYNNENGTASITIGDVTVSNLVNGEYVDEVMAGITLTGYVTFEDLATAGSTVINGSNITTGTISADRINMSGAITWSDLSTSCKNTIKSYAGTDGEDGADAEIPDYMLGWRYGNSTYIDGEMIMAGTVMASDLLGGHVGLLDANEVECGHLTITKASSYAYAIELASTGAMRILADGQYAALYMEAGDAASLSIQTEGSWGYAVFSNRRFLPTNDSGITLGDSAYHWEAVYANTGNIIVSDRNKKNSIEDLPDKYIDMFDNLNPKRFKMNSGTSGRYHVGFIAQEVEEAMIAAGLDSTDFGGFVKDVDADGNDVYMLRYGEFDGVYAAKIKQLETRIAELENKYGIEKN